MEKQYVLSARGHRLGELKDWAGIDGAPIAVIGSGGLLSIGETIVEVPRDALLGPESYIVLPVATPQKEFVPQGS